MKIRTGFVSNSSSSSFIVRLEKDIDDYTLDEFRELCNSDYGFDPVKQLYYDLKNKEQSKEIDKWIQEDFGLDDLDTFEYHVNYDDDSENMSYMEHDFMPNLAITKRIIGLH